MPDSGVADLVLAVAPVLIASPLAPNPSPFSSHCPPLDASGSNIVRTA